MEMMMAAKMPITAEREDLFLRGYAETGSWSAACRAASPHLAVDSAGRNPPGHQTWRNHLANSLAFAERFEEAKTERGDRLLELAFKRIEEGTIEGIFYKGKPARNEDGTPAFKVKHHDQLLIKALMAHFKEWRDTKEINVNVQGHWTLSASDLEALNDDELATFTAMLERIRDHRKHASLNVIDAEVIEVDEVDHVARIEYEIEREADV